MRKTLAARVVAGAAALIVGLAFAGCTATTTPSADDQDLAVGVQYPIENLDPHGASSQDAGTQLAAMAIFSPLLTSAGPGKFTGDLAESWKANEDASTWTFTLRDGVEFSDGTPLTSADVVASFQRLLGLGGPLATNFTDYTVAAPDKSTVVFTPPGPDAALLGKLTLFMVTPADIDERGFEDPIGSGPFVVDDFEPGAELRLKANPDYWGGKPALDTLELRTIPEIAARMTALQTGEIQAAWGMPDDQVATLREDPNLTVKAVPTAAVTTIWMNGSTIPDADVRRALWQAVDFKTIVSSLFPETGTPADSVVAPTVLGYTPQEPVTYDPDAAKAALEKAGFDFSTTLRFQFSQPQFAEVAQAIASDLSAIGVHVDVLEKESAVFLDDLLGLDWDISIQNHGSTGFDAATSLGRLYTCKAARIGYCNPKLDKILAAAGSTADVKKREEFYAQAIQIVWNDAVGMYPMFVRTPYAWQSNVKGFVPAPDGRVDFSTVSIAAGS